VAVSEQLKAAISNYGSQYRVAKDSGVPQQTIQRFMTGRRSLHLNTVDRLCEFFEMKLTRPKRRPPKKMK
jgi:hypothetical protein